MALFLARLALGGMLFAGALGLALRDRHREVQRYGVPDAGLAALAWAEVVSAALFVVPRTARAGAAALSLTLIAAMSIHLRHGETPWPLLVFLVLVVALGALSGRRASR
jgi:hypothetical protein